MRLHSPSFTISVKKYLLEFSDSVKITKLSKGDQNLIEEFPYSQIAFDETQLPVLLYVAGYAAKKVASRLSCGGCKQLLVLFIYLFYYFIYLFFFIILFIFIFTHNQLEINHSACRNKDCE